ncbi:MAG: tRNA threonylcarbamoyladenosine dehydratase [Oscillospiraceae bacterium]|nr:tRNA threonylcarbamoyladenosine dehydratase [Oscillospiraceae bacterium]
MDGQTIRTRMLLGDAAMERLRHCRVAVFGLGGVGSYAVEALARSGLGALDLIDSDTLAESNLNRQLLALHSTLGLPKTEAAARRVRDIDPDIRVTCRNCFYLPETAGDFDFTQYDYIIDAIDTVTGKIQLALQAREAGTPIISAMGTGNKLDPAALRVADISETRVCPLARVMRKELRRRGLEHLKVVYSEEKPLVPMENPAEREGSARRSIPGSAAFVPGAAGLLLAATVVCDLTEGLRREERMP